MYALSHSEKLPNLEARNGRVSSEFKVVLKPNSMFGKSELIANEIDETLGTSSLKSEHIIMFTKLPPTNTG